MIGIRTSDKQSSSPPKTKIAEIRRSLEGQARISADVTTQAGPVKEKRLSRDGGALASHKNLPGRAPADRLAEARACLVKGKNHLSDSRNLKTDIKAGVMEALDRLYQMMKDAEAELKALRAAKGIDVPKSTPSPETSAGDKEMLQTIGECTRMLAENNTKMAELQLAIEDHRSALEKTATYANVAAGQSPGAKPQPKRSTLHSVVVASKDETHTGDQVLEMVREAIDAKEGWVRVERVRKAKDRKIVMGFETETERNKAKERLGREGTELTVEEVKNRDPLLILRDVLTVNTDEDIIKALRNQNRGVFGLPDGDDDRLKVKFRRRARNTLTNHVVVSVSPIVWRRAVGAGYLHVDLQRVRVEDQSPLVQCTRCLGYGHGKRFCKEPADLCSHCGGPHMQMECPDRAAGMEPTCRNCEKERLKTLDHNAFSSNCPVRKRWDMVARASVAYC